MAKRPMRNATNEETISHLMNFAKSGPVAQLFIMDALAKHASAVAALSDEEAVEKIGNNAFIGPLAWRDAAREIKQVLDDHFAGKRLVPFTVDEDE